MSNDASTLSEHTLIMKRSLKADIQRVYDAWSKPENFQQWFGPKGVNVTEIESDFRAGGEWSLTMSTDSGNCFPYRGEYLEIEEPRLIKYRSISGCHGCDAEGKDLETVVTVELREVESGTELTLTHEYLDSPESVEGHEFGWGQSFERLEDLLG